MRQLDINTISGGTYPINIYACNAYQNNCVLFGTITDPVPPMVSFILPTEFDIYPVVGILLQDDSGCERFEIAVCGDSGYTKIFQDTDDNHVFQFMDFVIYQFEGPV